MAVTNSNLEQQGVFPMGLVAATQSAPALELDECLGFFSQADGITRQWLLQSG